MGVDCGSYFVTMLDRTKGRGKEKEKKEERNKRKLIK